MSREPGPVRGPEDGRVQGVGLFPLCRFVALLLLRTGPLVEASTDEEDEETRMVPVPTHPPIGTVHNTPSDRLEGVEPVTYHPQPQSFSLP